MPAASEFGIAHRSDSRRPAERSLTAGGGSAARAPGPDNEGQALEIKRLRRDYGAKRTLVQGGRKGQRMLGRWPARGQDIAQVARKSWKCH